MAVTFISEDGRRLKMGERPKRGRAEIWIDPDEVRRLGAAGFTIVMMADYFGVSQSVMTRRMRRPEYNLAYRQGRAQMDLSLAQTQLAVAIRDRNPRMLIHLGKNRLGQSDKVTIQPKLPNPDGDDETSVTLTPELEDKLERLALAAERGEFEDAEYEEID